MRRKTEAVEAADDRRFFRCPADVTIGLLSKFLRCKYDVMDAATHKVNTSRNDWIRN